MCGYRLRARLETAVEAGFDERPVEPFPFVKPDRLLSHCCVDGRPPEAGQKG